MLFSVLDDSLKFPRIKAPSRAARIAIMMELLRPVDDEGNPLPPLITEAQALELLADD